jgi:hypothetical protein
MIAKKPIVGRCRVEISDLPTEDANRRRVVEEAGGKYLTCNRVVTRLRMTLRISRNRHCVDRSFFLPAPKTRLPNNGLHGSSKAQTPEASVAGEI